METLFNFVPGDAGIVTGYATASGTWKSRLLAMGMTVGTEFTVANVAPLGDPVELSVRGSRLTLRKGEAKALLVERKVESRENEEDGNE